MSRVLKEQPTHQNLEDQMQRINGETKLINAGSRETNETKWGRLMGVCENDRVTERRICIGKSNDGTQQPVKQTVRNQSKRFL